MLRTVAGRQTDQRHAGARVPSACSKPGAARRSPPAPTSGSRSRRPCQVRLLPAPPPPAPIAEIERFTHAISDLPEAVNALRDHPVQHVLDAVGVDRIGRPAMQRPVRRRSAVVPGRLTRTPYDHFAILIRVDSAPFRCRNSPLPHVTDRGPLRAALAGVKILPVFRGCCRIRPGRTGRMLDSLPSSVETTSWHR